MIGRERAVAAALDPSPITHYYKKYKDFKEFIGV
jgi:hypothetical protein